MSNVKNDKAKTYEVNVPVFKKGDDLHFHLDDNPGDPGAAFLSMAEQYDAASEVCRKVANVILENKGKPFEVYANTHMISLTAPEAVVSGLVSDGILDSSFYDECEEDDECDDEKCPCCEDLDDN